MSYNSVSALFQAICNAIRAKTGSSALINHQDIPDEIEALPSGGLDYDTLVDGSLSGEDIVLTSAASIREYGLYSRRERSISNPSGSVKRLGKYALALNPALKSVSLPGLTYIDEGACSSLSFLESFDFTSVQHIEYNAFSGCAALEATCLPAVTEIGNTAFSGCTKIKTLELPVMTTTTYMGFSGSLIETLITPALTSIGMNGIRGATALTSITLDNVTSIGSNAFYECKKLPSILLPHITGRLGGYEFYNCEKATVIDVGHVDNISACCFFGCKALDNIVIRKDTAIATLNNVNAFMNCGGRPITVYVPQALIADYQVATNWSSIPSTHAVITFAAIEGSEYEL